MGSAMPMFKALKACPDAVVLKPDFKKYELESRRIFARLNQLSPLVQTLALDEAWIDLSGTERLNGGSPAYQLIRLQKGIEDEIGLTVSIGLAPNRFLAKLASEFDKPRGFSVINRSDAKAILAPRPVKTLPGVGPVFGMTLRSDGFSTIGDLARAELSELVRRYGDTGQRLHDLSHGRDSRPVRPDQERKGMSAETTFDADLETLEALESELWPLCEKVAAKARREGLCARTVVLKLRRPDFKIISRRRTLPDAIRTARSLFSIGRELLTPELGTPYRLIGIGLADVHEQPDAPASLFDTEEDRASRTETAIDTLRGKFGKGAVVAGRTLKSP